MCILDDGIERDLGVQPVFGIMNRHGLRGHDLVAVSTKQLTHKMVARACKGRRLTFNSKAKVLEALNLAAEKEYTMGDLFNY